MSDQSKAHQRAVHSEGAFDAKSHPELSYPDWVSQLQSELAHFDDLKARVKQYHTDYRHEALADNFSDKFLAVTNALYQEGQQINKRLLHLKTLRLEHTFGLSQDLYRRLEDTLMELRVLLFLDPKDIPKWKRNLGPEKYVTLEEALHALGR